MVKTQSLTLIEKMLGKITHRALAVSKQVAADLVGAHIFPSEKMQSIELGFDMDFLNLELGQSATLRKNFGISHNAFVISIIGRMIPVKAMDLFLQGTVPLLAKLTNLHLVLIGDGPERKDLEKLADLLCLPNLELRKRIHFTGWIYPFPRELKEINLCVCSSKNEGTSVAIIEAMIAGVPVISTRVGGMPDLLKEGEFGSLIAEESSALEEECLRIYQLRENSEFREHLQKIAMLTKNRFNQNRLLSEVAHLYEELHG